MKYNTILEYQDAISVLTERNLGIIDNAKVEVRSLNDAENTEFTSNKDEILSLKAEMEELTRKLESEETLNNLKKISIDNKMSKTNDFSLIRSLSDAYNSGKREKIVINRANVITGESGEGEDIVPVDLISEIIMPLKEEYLFGKLPVRVKEGLNGNYQIPVFGGGSLSKDAHVGETGMAAEYTANFDSITMTPHRFSVWTTLSKQWLIQAIPQATDSLVEDLGRQFWEKIEALLLSDATATENRPAGLLKGLTSTEVSDYAELCDFEAELREKKYRNAEFVVAPKAEAAFKSTIMGTNNTGMIMQNGKVDGIDTVVTSSLTGKDFIFGDFSQVQFAFWENPEITFFDDFQLAQNGQVGVILSGFYDVKLLRSDALALGEVVTA